MTIYGSSLSPRLERAALSRRRALALTGAVAAEFVLADRSPARAAAPRAGRQGLTSALPSAGGVGPVAAVSRSPDLLDVFTVGSDGGVYAAASQPGDNGFRAWWPIGTLVTGMTDPEVGRWRKVGVALFAENTGFSEEAQSVTTDGGAWYLVSNGSKTIRKMNDRGRPHRRGRHPRGRQGAHVGAPGYHDGRVYVPVQRPYGVWKVTADLSRTEWWPVTVAGDQFPWCAVNPLNGRLYTSLSNAAGTPVLLAYDRNTLQRRPEDDIRLGPGPIPLESVQGGHFTPAGAGAAGRVASPTTGSSATPR